MPLPKRAFLVISCVAILNGCAMAAGFKIASMAGTSLSYLISGKSLSDHVISGAMGSDCALHRIIGGQAPCRAKGENLVADGQSFLPGTTTALAFTSVEPVEIDVQSPSSIDNPDPGWPDVGNLENRLALLDPDLIADETSPRLFVVVGSYRELSNAQNHLAREDGAKIAPAIVNDRQHFRVVLGPVVDNISALARPESGLKTTGGWPVWLCPDILMAPPCFTQVALAP